MSKTSDIYRESFGSLAKRLGESIGRLELRAPSIRNSRYGAYLSSVQWLAASYQSNDEALAEQFPSVANSLLEAMELLAVFQFLESLEGEQARRMLKRICRGPVAYTDENPASATNAARNLHSELFLAAKLMGCGLLPALPEAEDVRVNFRGRPIYFECKRPFGSPSFQRNLEVAAKQLESRYSNANKLERGIIYMDVTRVANPDWGLLSVPGGDDIGGAMDREIDREIAENSGILSDVDGSKTIGIAFRLACMAVLGPDNLLTYGSHVTLMALPKRSQRDIGIVRKLVSQIEQSEDKRGRDRHIR